MLRDCKNVSVIQKGMVPCDMISTFIVTKLDDWVSFNLNQKEVVHASLYQANIWALIQNHYIFQTDQLTQDNMIHPLYYQD